MTCYYFYNEGPITLRPTQKSEAVYSIRSLRISHATVTTDPLQMEYFLTIIMGKGDALK
jgi:hypothetical protein